MNSIRTDLALEAKEISHKRYGSVIPGILTENEHSENIHISRVRIISEEGEKNLGKPQGVYITLDALASQKASRIGSSIQITNTGINPGSGIGNKRTGLNKQTLGVEIIAIGVPTVVYARTIGKDSLNMLVDVLRENAEAGGEFMNILEKMDQEQMDILLDRILSQGFGDLVVTPKDVDTLIEFASGIIADGLNIALHSNISIEEVRNYMQ